MVYQSGTPNAGVACTPQVRHRLTVLRRLLARWLTVPLDGQRVQDLWGRQEALSHALDALRERVSLVEHADAVRAAEHAAALDSMARLYKRVSARIARESLPNGSTQPKEESPLDLRRRLRP